jgi:phage baseplate assembly protein W
MSTYRGFSTAQSLKKYSLTDFDLARRDLINYFNIRKGEKLMQPGFGTIIWDMLFEPLSDDVRQTITADITRIVSYDPRLTVNQVSVTQQTQGLQIELTLTYVPTDQTAKLALNFDNQAQRLTTN